MKVLFISDAWRPQVNGVVRTLEALIAELETAGIDVAMITPDGFRTFPMPGYSEIRLSLVLPRTMRRKIADIDPEHIHIATEGPLGIAGSAACIRLGRSFTTSYHTRFPEYLRARLPVPLDWTYSWLRRFHNSGSACLVATQSIGNELHMRGFQNLVQWTRGVDHALFKPRPEEDLAETSGWARPIFLNVGRVSVEKNLEAFLDLDLPGTKLVVGDGPALGALKRRYSDVVFTGAKSGLELARHYNAADVFVFPSLTDTFGNVLLEAAASGLPVAAFPVAGPLDVIDGSGAGVLDADLRRAALAALEIHPDAAVSHSMRFTWEECARIFLQSTGIEYSSEPFMDANGNAAN